MAMSLGIYLNNPIVPNGFADHYPYEKLLFRWEYTWIASLYPMVLLIIILMKNGYVIGNILE